MIDLMEKGLWDGLCLRVERHEQNRIVIREAREAICLFTQFLDAVAQETPWSLNDKDKAVICAKCAWRQSH